MASVHMDHEVGPELMLLPLVLFLGTWHGQQPVLLVCFSPSYFLSASVWHFPECLCWCTVIPFLHPSCPLPRWGAVFEMYGVAGIPHLRGQGDHRLTF